MSMNGNALHWYCRQSGSIPLLTSIFLDKKFDVLYLFLAILIENEI